MRNILKNSWMLFTRNREYFSSIVLSPVIMLLIFSFILSFQSKVNVAVINLDNGSLGTMIEETIAGMDFINPLIIDPEEVENDIRSGKINLAVIIAPNATHMETPMDTGTEKPVRFIKSQNSGIAEYMEIMLNTTIETYKMGNVSQPATTQTAVSQNPVSKKGVPITNALGMVIFKMIGSASILAGIIITEKNNGIKNRIFMSKTKLSAYLLGRGIMLFAHLLLFSFVYFITAKLFHFDFGMKYPALILVVFSVLGVFTTAFGLLLSAFANDDNTAWRFGVLVLLPTSILSGALFPFDAMPESLQAVGNLFPQRWIAGAIEILQNGGNFADTLLPLLGVLSLSIVFFVTASVRLNKRRNIF